MQETFYNIADWQRFVDMKTGKLEKHFKPFTIEIKSFDAVSRNQQEYIFGVIYPRLKQALVNAGYEDVKNVTDDQFDYFLRGMFYFDIVKTSKGEVKLPRRLNFTKGKKEEVSHYIEDLLAFGARLGCYIPSPAPSYLQEIL